MSERKTAEIKLRIEPSRKAQWQQAAADEEIGLSEFIVNSCEDGVKNQRLGGIAAFTPYKGVATHEGGGKFSYDPPLPESEAPSVDPFADIPSVTTSDAAPTKCGDGKFGSDWKPWS